MEYYNKVFDMTTINIVFGIVWYAMYILLAIGCGAYGVFERILDGKYRFYMGHIILLPAIISIFIFVCILVLFDRGQGGKHDGTL